MWMKMLKKQKKEKNIDFFLLFCYKIYLFAGFFASFISFRDE